MISYNAQKKEFTLKTNRTKYVFHVVLEEYLQHDFYGAISDSENAYYRKEDPYRVFSPYPAEAYLEGKGVTFSPTEDMLEFSYFNSGDFRCSSLRVRGANGNNSTFFAYKNYEIVEKPAIPGIPSAKEYGNSETLALYLTDEATACELTLYYTVYPEFDVIARSFVLKNASEQSVKIEKAMSICLDLPGHEYDLISLHGEQNGERQIQRSPLFYGSSRIMSRRGASSPQLNPFIALADKDTNEECGAVYAFNFVFSGCFLDEIEVDQTGNTRVGIGLGEENFAYTLDAGEEFHSPEAIMLYSADGLSDMSRKLHSFTRATLLPAEIRPRRPIVLNTWEACGCNIDEGKLLDFARVGHRCGMDMLVVDDGWFGKRNDETTSLGDWFVDTTKFPNGLKAFAQQIKETGMDFGIWIEPEMVSPNSDLYRLHPDWCFTSGLRRTSLSRQQLVLDFCNPEVLAYLKNTFKKTFADVPIDYIKWDFNRHPSEVGSPHLPAERQDEANFRYYLGVYELYRWFSTEFPNTVIENCSAGGGRYDLAMMTFSPQIWCSDNTVAAARNRIQYGTSLAYPSSEMSCHVSDPGDGDDAMRTLRYKFAVALGGILGYELNVLALPENILAEITQQTMLYRQVEPLIKTGDLYRLISPFENPYEIAAYYYADKQADEILLSFLQTKPAEDKPEFTLKIAVAAPDSRYMDKCSRAIYTGKQLNEGIVITADSTGEYAQILYLCKM